MVDGAACPRLSDMQQSLKDLVDELDLGRRDQAACSVHDHDHDFWITSTDPRRTCGSTHTVSDVSLRIRIPVCEVEMLIPLALSFACSAFVCSSRLDSLGWSSRDDDATPHAPMPTTTLVRRSTSTKPDVVAIKAAHPPRYHDRRTTSSISPLDDASGRASHSTPKSLVRRASDTTITPNYTASRPDAAAAAAAADVTLEWSERSLDMMTPAHPARSRSGLDLESITTHTIDVSRPLQPKPHGLESISEAVISSAALPPAVRTRKASRSAVSIGKVLSTTTPLDDMYEVGSLLAPTSIGLPRIISGEKLKQRVQVSRPPCAIIHESLEAL